MITLTESEILEFFCSLGKYHSERLRKLLEILALEITMANKEPIHRIKLSNAVFQRWTTERNRWGIGSQNDKFVTFLLDKLHQGEMCNKWTQSVFDTTEKNIQTDPIPTFETITSPRFPPQRHYMKESKDDQIKELKAKCDVLILNMRKEKMKITLTLNHQREETERLSAESERLNTVIEELKKVLEEDLLEKNDTYQKASNECVKDEPVEHDYQNTNDECVKDEPVEHDYQNTNDECLKAEPIEYGSEMYSQEMQIGQKRFKCDQCDFGCKSEGYFIRHKRFKCDHC